MDLPLGLHALDYLIAAEQAIEPLLAALGLLAALPRAEAPDEFLLLLHVGLLLLIRPLLAQLLQIALLDERRIIPRIAADLAAVEPDDAGCEAIEQVAVM